MLEQTYPQLPSGNEMVFNIYNGVSPNLNCTWNDINLRYADGSIAAILSLEEIHSKIGFVEQGHFFIDETVISCDNGIKIAYPETHFYGPPKAKPVSESIKSIIISS